MGRSRGNFHSDDDPTQRSRRKKNAASGENLESASAGQGTGNGKKALYHCNYCNKDITGKIRIKCAVCPDFDLCIECFSVGGEVTPHKSHHPYRVMDNLSFPLICPDWNADDEILLLEGIEMYGLGNWAEVAEHVGTKSKELCIEHYTNVYLNSQYFPLPDMSHVVGKNRNELLAMAKGHGDDKKGVSMLGDHALKEESPFSPSKVKVEEMHKSGPSGRHLSHSVADVDSGASPNSTNGVKKASNIGRVKDSSSNVKLEEPQTERSSKGKRPNSAENDGPSLVESSGYNSKRREFDPEYDNDAEQLLAEMEFKDTDTEEEREIKLRVLRIYGKRLDERKRRKDFILERNLLYPNPIEKDFSPEEREICRRYDVFMRFISKEEHDEFLQIVISEYRTLKRIQELKVMLTDDNQSMIYVLSKPAFYIDGFFQEARAAGCRTSEEADRYLEQKRKREAEENSRRPKESTQVGPSHQGGANPFTPSDSRNINDQDASSYNEMQLLSEAEKRLCSEIRLPPPLYLKMQEVMTREIYSGNVTKRSDAYPLFKMEANKVDRVYEMLVKKGIASP